MEKPLQLPVSHVNVMQEAMGSMSVFDSDSKWLSKTCLRGGKREVCVVVAWTSEVSCMVSDGSFARADGNVLN